MGWKKITAIVLGVILLVVIGAAVFLVTYDYNALKPQIEAAVEKNTGRKLTLAGDISLALGLTPALVVEDVSLANAQWGSKPQMLEVGRFELQVALLPLFQRNVEIQRVVLRDTSVLVETNTKGVSNLTLHKPQAAAEPVQETSPEAPGDAASQKGPLPGLELDNVLVENGAIDVRDASGETVTSFSVQRLALQTLPNKDVQMTFDGQFNGQPLSMSGIVGPLKGLTDAQQQWPVDLAVQSGSASVAVEGAIRDVFAQRGLDLDLSATIPEPAALKPLVGQEIPVAGPIECTATLTDTAAKTFRLDSLQLRQGENRLSGTVSLALGPPLSVTADLTSPLLDVTAITTQPSGETAPPQEQQGASSADGNQRVFPDTELPWEALRQLNAQCSLQVGTLVVPKLQLADAQLELGLKDGLLNISRLTARSGDEGTLNATMTVDARSKQPRLECAARIEHFALEQVLRETKSDSFLQGTVSSDLAVTGQGRSVAAIMAGLDGKLQASMSEGRLANARLEKWGADLGASLFRLLNPMEERGRFTPIQCAVLVMPFDSGLARVQALVVDTPRMLLRGQGSINLRTETLDIGLDPQPKEGLQTGVLGKLSLSFSELAQAFRLGGTLAKPSLALDKAKTIETLGKGIGGTLLFGPAGAAAGLLGSSDTSDNPCLQALEGADATKEEQAEKSSSPQEQVEKGLEDLGGKLQKLFE